MLADENNHIFSRRIIYYVAATLKKKMWDQRILFAKEELHIKQTFLSFNQRRGVYEEKMLL